MGVLMGKKEEIIEQAKSILERKPISRKQVILDEFQKESDRLIEELKEELKEDLKAIEIEELIVIALLGVLVYILFL